MIRLVGVTALALTLLFVAVLGAAKLQPPGAIPELRGCAVACWWGVEPSVSREQDARETLTAAIGARPIRPECFSASLAACNLYLWVAPGDPASRTQVQLDGTTVQTVAAQAPGFKFGDVLLSMDALGKELDRVAAGFSLGNLYLLVTFARYSTSVSVSVACPVTYYALLQAPVESIVVQAPDADLPAQTTSFAALHQVFLRLCEG